MYSVIVIYFQVFTQSDPQLCYIFVICNCKLFSGIHNQIHSISMIRTMMFNATFNNISVMSSRSVLMVEETGGPGENYRSVASHWQTFSHNIVSNTPRHERGSNSQLE